MLNEENLLPLPQMDIHDYYRFETMLVSREGLISFDGVKYGVPWQYSGREVRIRLSHGRIDVFLDETAIASHEATASSGKILSLPGQYAGLAEKKGIAIPSSFARQESSFVEIRPLYLYDQLFEVSANG